MLCAYNSQLLGHRIYYVAGDDHAHAMPTAEIVAKHYPGVPWSPKTDHPHEGLVNCARAKEELGWEPKYTWRSYVKEEGKVNGTK